MMKAVNIRTSLGDAAYAFDEAVRQITVCARRREKAGTGLYLHAWTDPSGTAMFLYSLQRGIDLGLLPPADYRAAVERAWVVLQTFAVVNERGLVDVRGGGDGIGIKDDTAGYIAHPRVVNAKETIGGFLWAAVLMERDRLEARRRPLPGHSRRADGRGDPSSPVQR
jgi:rhamnogalacturonyl hydrolase YesR